MHLKTVAINAEKDKLSFYWLKSDEAYRVGKGLSPNDAYLYIDGIIEVAKKLALTLSI